MFFQEVMSNEAEKRYRATLPKACAARKAPVGMAGGNGPLAGGAEHANQRNTGAGNNLSGGFYAGEPLRGAVGSQRANPYREGFRCHD